MALPTKLLAWMVFCWLLSGAFGTYYIIKGTSTEFSTIGELIKSNIRLVRKSYYQQQIFQYNKNELNKTCSLIRQKSYLYEEDGEDVTSNTQLGTFREIWISDYDSNTCIDKSLKTYYTNIGTGLLCVFGTTFVVYTLYSLYNAIDSYLDSGKPKMFGLWGDIEM